ncbi:uncharacterized protein LOC113319397 isoform X2 [Papaver somniferum]|uniref:uncharacterized protein LOC113319397 isoform X2 n=1 Tax=Papaver somniferum TaxID=3469 RepID=UPI000E6F788F|nr:uncharacterized protein LOC113319397 isoform X2 [Papaver somniferum]
MTQQATDEEDPCNASTSNTKRDIAWEWAISVNRRVKCKLCGHEMSTIFRFKDHLLRIPGEVRPCPSTTPEIMNKVAESRKLKIQKKTDKKRIRKFFGDLDQIMEQSDVELDGGNVRASKKIVTKRKFHVVSDVRGPLDLLVKSDPAKQKTIQELQPAKKQLKLEAWDAIGAWQTEQKLLRKTNRDCEGAATDPIEIRDSKLKKKVMEEHDRSLDVTGIQPPATDDTPDTIGRKMENVERAEKSGEPESLTGITETVVESEILEHYKKVEETRKTAGTDESERTPADATECWRKMFSDLAETMESRILDLEKIVLRMDDKISTVEGCVESRISKLESLVLRSGKESSILRCVQLRHSEKMESEVQGSQNDVSQRCEKQTDENGSKDSDAYECKTKEKVLNVYDADCLRVSSEGENVGERKGWGCSEERPSQHGSSSQDHLEMSTEPFVNFVSDDDSVEILGEFEVSDGSTDSEGSLGVCMDMLAMKYRNTNEDKEIKWEFEADMLSSFEEDHELCMKAVCALYRQQISEGKGLLHNSDALRCTTLAKFLMNEDCEGDLNKSVKELEIFDSKGVEDCKRLARRYSTQLFSIYENGKDPFFLPATTASHGDETAK